MRALHAYIIETEVQEELEMKETFLKKVIQN